MLRNEGYDFLRLGGSIERADMTLRLLNVKYFLLLPETEVVGGGRDHHQWMSMLHAVSGLRAYHHHYFGDYAPWNIADFLLLNRAFPRSVRLQLQPDQRLSCAAGEKSRTARIRAKGRLDPSANVWIGWTSTRSSTMASTSFSMTRSSKPRGSAGKFPMPTISDGAS